MNETWAHDGVVLELRRSRQGIFGWIRVLLQPTLRVEVRQTAITVDGKRFDIRVLWRARFRHQRIVLGFRDGNDWASEPVVVDDPQRLVDILQAVMPTLEDFKQEGHAEHTVRRTLGDLRAKSPETPRV